MVNITKTHIIQLGITYQQKMLLSKQIRYGTKSSIILKCSYTEKNCLTYCYIKLSSRKIARLIINSTYYIKLIIRKKDHERQE